jgi:ubiquinone/menaquinone biosynthesis C-methylase UbiE
MQHDPVERTVAEPSKFWDKHAKGYAKRPVADEAAYQKKLKVTQDYLKPDMEVLEFGCGTGTTALIHAPFVRHIHAIDISGKMIEIARDKAEAGGIKNVTFERASVEDLTAADATYDAVMGHSILHLLEDRKSAIASTHRMLKPGGVFITSTACLGEMMPALKAVLRAILVAGRFFGLLPLVNFFTKDELERDLTDAGFRTDYQWQSGKGKSVFIVAKKV